MVDERQQIQEQLTKATETFKSLEVELAGITQRMRALRNIIAGYEELLRLCGAPVQQALIDLPKANGIATVDVRKPAPESFRSGILEIVQQYDQRKGLPLKELIQKVEERGLPTNALTLEIAVRNAVNGLQRRGLIKPLKNGMVRYNPPAKLSDETTEPRVGA